MRGRNTNGKSHIEGAKSGHASERLAHSDKEELPKPKKLTPVGGKKAIARLDKPTRGKLDANAYRSGGGIKIKASHKGMLHKDTKTPAGEKIPADKLEKAAHSKDKAVRKRAVFAENAKEWSH